MQHSIVKTNEQEKFQRDILDLDSPENQNKPKITRQISFESDGESSDDFEDLLAGPVKQKQTQTDKRVKDPLSFESDDDDDVSVKKSTSKIDALKNKIGFNPAMLSPMGPKPDFAKKSSEDDEASSGSNVAALKKKLPFNPAMLSPMAGPPDDIVKKKKGKSNTNNSNI